MKKLFTLALLALGITAILGARDPRPEGDLGAYSLIPAAFLILYIFATKRILESLIVASLIGFVLAHGRGSFSALNDAVMKVLKSDDMTWLFLVCGLMGSLIALIERAGGAFAFGEWVRNRAKSRESTLLWTWVLGLAIFIDDYLNSLTLGASMAPITDQKKVSREMLAYVVDSTAAPVCVLIPISTWGVFIGRLLESNGLAPEGQGLVYFVKTIPFNFYGWFAVLLVPLVILGIVPLLGPMKKAESRARETGVLAPPGSAKIDIKAGEIIPIPPHPHIANFVVPLLFLVGSTIWFDVDMAKGVVSTMAFVFLLFLVQRLVTASEFADLAIRGIKNMLFPLVLVILAFVFAEANEQIGFTAYVITSVAPLMSPALMPTITFLVLGATEFITGTNWGMYVIALPIVIPLSQQIGADPILVVSAVLSAGVFGSHICFYSDATILSSAATGCDNFEHAVTQLPYGLLAAGLSTLAFLAAGFLR
jgi:Na+/H+ antiporter NhaC